MAQQGFAHESEWVQRVEHKADALLIRRVAEEDEQYLAPAASLDSGLDHLPKDKERQVERTM